MGSQTYLIGETMTDVQEIWKMNSEVDFKPFRALRLWVLLSNFGEGKEDFLRELSEYFKKSYTTKSISAEKLRAIQYIYTEKRLSLITELEKVPFLAVELDDDGKLWKFFSSVLKARLRNPELLTVLLSDLDRDTFSATYKGVCDWGLVSTFASTNTLAKKKEEILNNVFKDNGITTDNFLDGVKKNESI